VLDDLRQALAAGIMPSEPMWFDEWADKNILLRRGTRKIPWQTAKTPYLREIMRCLSPQDPTARIVVQKSVQLGLSEMANAYCAYIIDQCPMPILFVQPDIERADNYSKHRLQPVLEDCRIIDGKIAAPKSRDSANTVSDKSYPGGPLNLVGANSAAGFASTPYGVFIFDEADRAKASAAAEGDQYELGLNRLITFLRSKSLLFSTPGLASTSRIEPEYLASDQRRYHTPCPLCSLGIELSFDRMVYPEDPKHAPLYRCQSCQKLFDQSAKPEMLASGIWVPKFPEREVVGFKLNGLHSMLDWREIDDRRRRAEGKLNKTVVFVNTIMGETFDMLEATKVEPAKLSLLTYPIAREGNQSIVPDEVLLLTAGVDVQEAGRLEAVLYGWGRGEECWHLEREIFRGEITEAAVWRDLAAWLRSIWTTTSGRTMRLSGTCIDYRGGASQRVAEFVRTTPGKRVWAILGAGGDRPLWPTGKPAKSKYGARLYRIGNDVAKQQIHASIKASIAAHEVADPQRIAVRGPNKIHIAAHLCADEVYLAGLVSEAPQTKYVKGRAVVTWEGVKGHAPIEPLDCAVYGYAALAAARAAGRARSLDTRAPVDPQPPAPNSVPLVKPSHRHEIQISTPAPPAPRPTPAPAQAPRKVPRYL
jgi:phage terminase large subunit GpA-like protein